MTVDVEPVHLKCPSFAGLLSGISVANGISKEDAMAIENGMNHFAVLVLRNQQITDDQQCAFSEYFGPMEQATGDIGQSATRRLSMKVNDISNLDENGVIMAIDDRRSLFSLGIRTVLSNKHLRNTPCYRHMIYR